MFNLGDYAYLARDIVEPACGDHPAFLMGEKGEKVLIVSKHPDEPFRYTVEGQSNKGKPWKAGTIDLMFSKPMRG